MTERSGPKAELRAAAVYAATATYYDCTSTITMGTRANSLRLQVTNAVASPGSVTFRLAVANPDAPTVFYDYSTAGESPETFGPLVFSAVASTKMLILSGLDLLPGDVVKVSFAASAAAASATVAIVGECFHSDGAGGDTNFGDVAIDVGDIETLLTNVPNVIGTDGAAGPTKTLSVAGTKADGTINEVLVGTGVMADALAVTMATDDVVSTATGIHDVAAAAKLGGFRLLGNATSALQTAVSAANDDAKINTDLSGQVRLASHNIATTSDRGEEIDPLSAQYAAIALISNEAVIVDPGLSYAPSSAGVAWGGYGPLSIGIYILGGIGAAAADRTVTVTIEATNGQTVGAAVMWSNITESVKSLLTGLDSAASFTSVGAASYLDILTLRREDSNFTHFRLAYDWDADPSVTPGKIVAVARGAAL